MIAIFYLAKPKYGGWVTGLAHGFRLLEDCGGDVRLFKVSDRSTSETKLRHFFQGVHSQKLCVRDAISIAKNNPSIVWCADKHHLHIARELLPRGSQIIVHDPMEHGAEAMAYLKSQDIKPIVQGPKIQEWLATKGLKSTLIPMPYSSVAKHEMIRMSRDTDKTVNAVAVSRIDFDKHTEIICAANEKLKEPIRIYGAENRMYTHFKLDDEYPTWRENNHGSFDNVYSILAKSNYMVDMSSIKNDGGRTQLTFMEAWDSGTVCVLNRKWDVGGEMVGGENCLYVDGADDLVDTLESNTNDVKRIVKNGYEALKKHADISILKGILSYE